MAIEARLKLGWQVGVRARLTERIDKDAKDKETIIKDAKNVLKQQKLLRKEPRTKYRKINFKERELLQKTFSVLVNEKYKGIFPDKLSFLV